MFRLRLFRPVVTLALVATLHSGFPMAAPMQAPVVPFNPPPSMTRSCRLTRRPSRCRPSLLRFRRSP